MATNNASAIQRMEDLLLLDHFSDRLLLNEARTTNLEALEILWKSGMVDFSYADPILVRILEGKVELMNCEKRLSEVVLSKEKDCEGYREIQRDEECKEGCDSVD